MQKRSTKKINDTIPFMLLFRVTCWKTVVLMKEKMLRILRRRYLLTTEVSITGKK